MTARPDPTTAEQVAADELCTRVMRRIGVSRASELQCPREMSFMTPCVARDAHTACLDDGACVGCGELPSALLAVERTIS
jgi:hypothetical protein